MTVKPASVSQAGPTVSWLPLVIIVIAQLQMGINVNALPVSLGPIVADLNAPRPLSRRPWSCIRWQWRLSSCWAPSWGSCSASAWCSRSARSVMASPWLIMALSRDTTMMNMAQLLAGLAAALLVPTLVVLIAANYHGKQQSQALGILASIPAISSGLAFVVAGFIATASDLASIRSA